MNNYYRLIAVIAVAVSGYVAVNIIRWAFTLKPLELFVAVVIIVTVSGYVLYRDYKRRTG